MLLSRIRPSHLIIVAVVKIGLPLSALPQYAATLGQALMALSDRLLVPTGAVMALMAALAGHSHALRRRKVTLLLL